MLCVFVHVCCCARFFFCSGMYIFLCLCACVCVWVCVCVCVGQGSKHAAVCRPAVPVNGGAADDAAAADGGGPEVAGAGGKAAGNTHSEHSRNSSTLTNTLHT